MPDPVLQSFWQEEPAQGRAPRDAQIPGTSGGLLEAKASRSAILSLANGPGVYTA